MRRGFINYFDINKNYGYITGYDNELYYFEFSSLNFPLNYLTKNLDVLFVARQNDMMLYALNINLDKDNDLFK